MQFERTCAFVERGAGSHHVVNQGNVFPAQIHRAVKCAADVFHPLAPGQLGLRQRVADAGAAQRVNRPAMRRVDRARKFQCLIEASFLQAQWMQW